jgi:hypothetical protein
MIFSPFTGEDYLNNMSNCGSNLKGNTSHVCFQAEALYNREGEATGLSKSGDEKIMVYIYEA